MKEFHKNIKSDKNNAEAYYNVGTFYMYESDCEKAIEWFNKGITINPKEYKNYLGLGAAYYELSKYDLSIKYLSQALTLNPYNISVYDLLQQIYLKKGDINTTLYWIEKGIEKNPKCKNLYVYLFHFETISDKIKQNIDSFLIKNPISDDMKECETENPIVGGYDKFKWDKKLNTEQENILSWINNDINKIINIAQKHNKIIILMNYPYRSKENPFALTYEPVNKVLANIANSRQIPFIDNQKVFSNLFSKTDSLMEPVEMGMHPTKKGYSLIAKNIYIELKNLKIIK
jgi:tetratricopeptide (TPR) repeat protein